MNTPTHDDPPLAGLKVLDFTRVLAGPFCTAMFADAGAQVLKVEPFDGDDYRHMGFQVQGRSTNFAFVNRGKHSLRMNLKSPSAARIIDRLAPWADVVVENFKPGVADRLGIGYERLSALNPGLIYCSISGFGQQGTWADRPAYDTIIQALSGLMAANGHPDGPPTVVGESLADVSAGMFGAWGIMAALWQRSQTGRGRHLDIAMYDCLVSMMPTLVSRVVAGGAECVRVGNRHLNSAPFGAFRAVDGMYVLAVANQKLFQQLADAMGQPALARDARFASNALRKKNEAALAETIERWSGAMTVGQAVAALQAHDVPAAPVLDVRQSVATPYATERGLVRTHELDGGGTACHVEQPVRFGNLPRRGTAPAPELGIHTQAILRELGFAEQDILVFRNEGLI
ncbi:CoA transferase [Pigmentiphaga sp.]|uniref:CaiB/BaiF CoA transferase family protein n=1 Tax=Pigmentiphaga sp. TaxID=1977564 RepID=UPI0025F8A1B1|nr:CoA transferase [Pigmentiphaga sp.]